MARQHEDTFIDCLVDRDFGPSLPADDKLKQQLLMESTARAYMSSMIENFLSESPEQVRSESCLSLPRCVHDPGPDVPHLLVE